VAAHLEPEILIVDEVLAVGDAAFQKKCLGRMREVAGEGRTVLFVSHNMEAVQKLCNKGILLNKGKLVANDTIESVVRQYLDSSDRSLAEYFPSPPPGMDGEAGHVQVIRIEREDGVLSGEIPVLRPFRVVVQFEIKKKLEHFIAAIGISTMMDQSIRTIWAAPQSITPGTYKAVFHLDDIYLATGLYKLVVGLSSHERSFHYVDNLATFEIADATDGFVDNRIVNFRSGLLLNQSRVDIFPEN
jgi:lipopolysaccharide transport system ATP-binding protein